MNKILIIDDSLLNIQMLHEILSSEYLVSTCSSTREISEQIGKNTPDLILLDVLMPEKDGYQICSELKSNNLSKDIPVIFITAKSGIDDKIKGLSLGAQDYITRPFYAKEVLERIKVHLSLKKSKERLEHYLKLLEEKNQRLLELSKVDFLTEVANRRYIIERIKEERLRAIEHNKTFFLALCDIDFFKEINDNFGHEVGDLVLKEMASEIKKKINKEDLLARWGGEEFLILFPETSLKETKNILENLRNHVANFSISEKGIVRTLTIGLTEFNLNFSIEDNINNADKVLYKGKRSGRNRIEVY